MGRAALTQLKDYWQIICAIVMLIVSFTALKYDVSNLERQSAAVESRVDRHEVRQSASEVVDAQTVVKLETMQRDVTEVKTDVNEIQKDIKTLLRAK